MLKQLSSVTISQFKSNCINRSVMQDRDGNEMFFLWSRSSLLVSAGWEFLGSYNNRLTCKMQQSDLMIV